jgi:hypothetical protein
MGICCDGRELMEVVRRGGRDSMQRVKATLFRT